MFFRPWLLSPHFYSYFLDKEETGDLPVVFFNKNSKSPLFFVVWVRNWKKRLLYDIRSRYRNVNAKLVKSGSGSSKTRDMVTWILDSIFPRKRGPSTGTHYLVISQINQLVRFAFSSVDFFVEKKNNFDALIEFPNSNKVVLKFLARLKSHSVISCFLKK